MVQFKYFLIPLWFLLDPWVFRNINFQICENVAKIFLLLIHNLIPLWSQNVLEFFMFIDICFVAQFLVYLGKCFVYIWKNEYSFKYSMNTHSNEYSNEYWMGGMFCKHKLGPAGWWCYQASILLRFSFHLLISYWEGLRFAVIVDLLISPCSPVTLCFMFFESLIRCINI